MQTSNANSSVQLIVQFHKSYPEWFSIEDDKEGFRIVRFRDSDIHLVIAPKDTDYSSILHDKQVSHVLTAEDLDLVYSEFTAKHKESELSEIQTDEILTDKIKAYAKDRGIRFMPAP